MLRPGKRGILYVVRPEVADPARVAGFPRQDAAAAPGLTRTATAAASERGGRERRCLRCPAGISIDLEGGWVVPTYEFVCEKCNKEFTVILSISEYEQKKAKCPKCQGKKVRRLISSFHTKTSKKS